MKNIKISWWGILLVLTLLWMLADSFFPEPFTYFSFRNAFVQYTGVIAIATIAVSLYLAIRPKWLDQKLDGLDKVYRLHKWMGITALVSSLLHWWWAKGTKYLVMAGFLQKPQAHEENVELSGIQNFFLEQRAFAEELGEIMFYIFLVLIVLALVKKFPYKYFVKTHKILAYVFIVLVFHSVVLLKYEYWSQPVGIATALFILVGLISSFFVIFGKIGAGRKATGHICTLDYFPELSSNDIDIQMDEGWPGHQPGQFAFLKSIRKEKAHPYTIASAWNPQERKIKFVKKALGDYTSTLHDVLKIGEKVTIEGPYGNFTFEDNKDQIWIGGGIGITPFIAKMKQYISEGNALNKNITLFHSTKEYSEKAMNLLKGTASQAGITLHIFHDATDGFLTGEKLRNLVPYWKRASVWFCGPSGFARVIKKDLKANGFKNKYFHQELFQMR